MFWLNTVILELMILTALVTDIRTRKIPNVIPAVGLVAGIILGVMSGDIVDSLKGFAVVTFSFLAMYATGCISAGDVKFMMASAMLLGYELSIVAVYVVVAAGVVISLLILARKGRLMDAFKYSWEYIRNLTIFVIHLGKISVPKPEKDRVTEIPYMPVIAIGINITLMIHIFA